MVWVKHDDTYSDRPEIAALSDAAFRDHFRLVEYVCRYVTDGRIPKAITDRVRTMPELLKAGLYGEVPGFYVLGGWREHALSTEQVEARKAAGKAGGLAKARRLPKQKAGEERSKGSTVPVPVPVSDPEPVEASPRAVAPRKRAAQRNGDPRVNSVKAAWEAMYATATGEEPKLNHGLFGKQAKELLRTHDEPEIVRRANAFLGSERGRMQGFRFEAFYKDFALYNGHAPGFAARPETIAAVRGFKEATRRGQGI